VRQAFGRRARRILLLSVILLCVAAVSSCAPAMAPTPAAEQPSATRPEPTQAPAVEEPAVTAPTATIAARPPPTQAPAQATGEAPAPTQEPLVEGRLVELEWPEALRLGDSDVIRLALVPTQEGYVAQAEFPDHALQSKEIPVPRPNGYELYALARLDGVGFEIAPSGDQERFVPEGEEVAWRWTLSPLKPGQQRLSVSLVLRWVPGPGVSGSVRESQAYARAINVQVRSFMGMSPAQAASTGFLGLLLGGSLLLASLVRVGDRQPPGLRAAPGPLEPVEPNPDLTIEAPAGMALAEEESGLLRGLFRSYARVAIESEFLSGYSGARTFLIRPIRPDDCADAPTIVKLGSQESIRQEFENYEAFVKDRLPPMTARIQRAPVTLVQARRSSAPRAAVQYTFIAEPGRPPVSLRQALLQNPDPALLLRLFETFGPSWWMQRRPYTFRMGIEYDRLLPPHYVLEPVTGDQGGAYPASLAETETPARLAYQPGALVRLRPFRHTEPRADGRSYTLHGLQVEGQPVLRLRWLGTAPLAPVVARVVATRMDLLRGWTRNLDRFNLPDPLDALPKALEEMVPGTRSVIHGDLNLENVLVGPGSLVWLIDFATTREGHPLFDFAHLESELIAHVLSARAGSPKAYLELWQSDADPLLNTLHGIAGRCLFDPARPREYRQALYLACLGALKYQNLTPLARHCLYLTGAALAS